jgi:hypothetical protein
MTVSNLERKVGSIPAGAADKLGIVIVGTLNVLTTWEQRLDRGVLQQVVVE